MSITFVGFFRLAATEVIVEYQRGHDDNFPPEFQQKVRDVPSLFSDSLKLVGSWGVGGGEVPGVMVVEVDSFADLQVIDQHYNGWLNFDWHPTNTGGVPRD